VDADHANFAQFVEEAWPDDGAMDELRKQGTLDPQPFPLRYESDGVAVATIALPMPGVVRLQLRPV
jgi:hypothetical protein